ncbi:condensation domain-containing protein [Streptomyces sp. NPDC002730]|uniref:condensation domain-containing protein n=1 Tax=Streptomyces sp. NPDC002730 TaxID=3364662 RepID=UPI00367E9902
MDAEPYGLQREMLLRAQFGADGHPVVHRYPPVHELLLLRGPLDTALLGRAVRRATEGVDVLRGRLRARGDGTVCWVPDRGRPPARLKEIEPGPARQVIRASLREAAEASFHLQDDPAARFLLARTGPDEHLLLIALDHSCADGRTLVLIIRHLLYHYAVLAGETVHAPASFPSFHAFAGQFGESAERTAARAYWQRALDRAADGHRRPRFPGAKDSEVTSYSTDAAAQLALGDEDLAVLNRLAQAVGSDRHRLLLGATQLVLSAWSDEAEPLFVPFNYFRNGRHRRDRLNVPGPLAEHAVTVPPQQEPRLLGDWLAGFVRANAAAPPFHGLSLRELETPATEDSRIAVFNFLPPLGRLTAAGLRVLPCPPELSAEMEPEDQTARFALRVRLVQDMDAPLIFRIEHDPRVLPDGTPFLDAALGVVRAADQRPGRPLAEAYRKLRQHWT